MKIKSFALSIFLFIVSCTLSAQLRIDEYGRIGMGTNFPNPGYKCHIKGNLLLTTYPEIPPSNMQPVELRFKVGNGWPGAEIGTNIDEIAFWSFETGYNKLYAEEFYTQSDSTTKENIQPVQSGLESIMQLNPCSYQMKSNSLKKSNILKRRFGFLAQEVKEILPEITDSAKGIMLVDYNQIIPLLVDAIKEQNQIIVNLQQKMDEYINEVSYCCDKNNSTKRLVKGNNNSENSISNVFTSKLNQTEIGTLYQNNPNPFSEQTKIKYAIKNEMTNASIMVFDMQGTLKLTIPIHQTGKGEITINGHKLTAGMYLYSLIIDNQEIDTKRMILAN